MTEETKPIKIKGVSYWACLTQVNSLSDKYQIDISQLSEAAVKALEAMGLTVMHKDEQGFYITCKSKLPIFYVDEGGNRMDEKVGNGSEVTAIIGVYDWKFKNKTGKSANLKKLVINKLVRYEGALAEIDDEEAL